MGNSARRLLRVTKSLPQLVEIFVGARRDWKWRAWSGFDPNTNKPISHCVLYDPEIDSVLDATRSQKIGKIFSGTGSSSEAAFRSSMDPITVQE